MTHLYVTDIIDLDPKEFVSMGAPQDAEAFACWIFDNADSLMTRVELADITRLKLSKLDFYTEERDQRLDETKIELQ